jgi:hypothetical protein
MVEQAPKGHPKVASGISMFKRVDDLETSDDF